MLSLALMIGVTGYEFARRDDDDSDVEYIEEDCGVPNEY